MRLLVHSFFLSLILTAPVAADSVVMINRYFAALKMSEVFDILSEEGVEAGLEIADEEEGISASPAWTARIKSIYSIEKMEAAFRHGLTGATDIEASEEAVAFFESPFGQRVVNIELDARRALSDESIEDAVREQAAAMREENPKRLELYDQFIDVNDLVDSNVMGALNANLAFYQGLGTNPIFGGMDESSMLGQVYSQEGEIRDDMEDWTVNFSVLAYGLLTDQEVEDYIAISETKAGQVLNTALFAGFDKVFELQSFELGRAMAEFMVGDDT